MTDDDIVGMTIGSYRVERKLAAGGMGAVYLGVQPAIGSRVAIKVISERCAADASLVERFFSEARAVNLIKHEAIINVLDMARLPDGRPYLVMEYIDGQTLGHIVRRSRPPLGGIARAIGETLGALGAAHAAGVVHRDLKPDNIMITAKGHAKVLDFGLAKLVRDQLAPRTYTDDFMGTPAYMSPEQIADASRVDARADLYAIGVVLYEAVTGERPFNGTTMEIMQGHVGRAPMPPRALRPELPPAFEAVILMALAKDPNARFATANAMRAALAHAARELPPDQQANLALVADVPAPRVETPLAPSVIETPPAPSMIVTPPAPSAIAPRTRWPWLALPIAIAAIVAVVIVTRGGANLRKLRKPVVIERPSQFDIHTFLPTARELARAEAPDAELVEFQLRPLVSHGRIDLTRAQPGENRVVFVSKQSKPCIIVVEITANRAKVLRRDEPCARRTVRFPRCKLAALFEAGTAPLVDQYLGSETSVRYAAGKKLPRWEFLGLDSGTNDDDCENGDRDER